GWTLTETYLDDGKTAKTGRLAKRDGFARLMCDAEARRFDVLVVLDINRLTRTNSIEERAQILGPFQRLGISIVTPSGGQQDLRSFLGELYVTMQALVSAEENRKRAEPINARKDPAVAEGKKPAGPTPFGYSYDRHTGWSPHPTQALIVVEMFERIRDGETLQRVGDDLSARGILRPHGGEWGREHVYLSEVCSVGHHVTAGKVGSFAAMPTLRRKQSGRPDEAAASSGLSRTPAPLAGAGGGFTGADAGAS
ncbi:MAG: hypothetical protein F9K40_10375, partial [Kofleriaceae bacterium]